MAKIGIIGKGFVGSAVYNGFDVPENELLVCDTKIQGTLSIKEIMVKSPEFVFVCVPTPIKKIVKIDGSNKDEFGQVDTTYVSEVLADISKYTGPNRNPIVIVKSTITPDYWQHVPKNLDIVYNPELLRETNGDYDFCNPPCVVLGGDHSWCMLVESLYKTHSKVHMLCPYIYTTRELASMFKYTINSWLATKVSFFNQLYALMTEMGMNQAWDHFTSMISADPRIGFSHMQVPGPDGNFGFGGSCFPKDTEAFLKFGESLGVDLSVLREAVDSNRKIR